jgi:hypothetical protein
LEELLLMVEEQGWPVMQHKWGLSGVLRFSSSNNYIRDMMDG